MPCSWYTSCVKPKASKTLAPLSLNELPPSLNTMASWRESYSRKKKSYEVAFRDEASCFLGVRSYVNDTFWKNGMVFQSLFHGLEISFHCLPHGTIGFGQNSLEVHSRVEGEHYRGSAVQPVSPKTSDDAIRVRGYLP